MAEAKSRNLTSCLIVAVVLVILFLAPIALFWFFVRSLEGEPVRVEKGSVLELDLATVTGEGPAGVDLGPFFSGGAMSLWDLTRTIDAAADDDDVVAILLVMRGSFMGWASAEEVLEHLDAFRDSQKPIYALLEGDVLDDLTYYLATAADQVWMAPATAAAINGLAVESPFFRGTLDKLHIVPEVIMMGNYKSAGEPFLNYEMSPYMRESLQAVLETTRQSFVERVAARRGREPAQVESTLERAVLTAREVIDAGLADEIGYLDQVEAALVEATGIDEYRGIDAHAYRSARDRSGGSGSGDRLALVFGEGPVLTDAPPSALPFLESRLLAGTRVADHIREAAEDDSVKAIVFRVNSPGGSAVGSDVVRRAIEQARAAGKTVVVSMSDVAGSGGYWVAMAADAIVAHPTTITGSIGVVFTKFNFDPFLEWIGTRMERIETHPGADALGFGPLGEQERQRILAWMEEVYDLFTGHVATERELDPARVQEIAQGRIWSGRDALEIGLVDRLGGLDDAFALAKEKAGLDPDRKYPLELFPRQRTLFEALFSNGWGTAVEAARGGLSALAGLRGGPLGAGGAAGEGGVLGSGEALEYWMRRAAAPQVLARAPEIRIR
jgi:protease-4